MDHIIIFREGGSVVAEWIDHVDLEFKRVVIGNDQTH